MAIIYSTGKGQLGEVIYYSFHIDLLFKYLIALCHLPPFIKCVFEGETRIEGTVHTLAVIGTIWMARVK